MPETVWGPITAPRAAVRTTSVLVTQHVGSMSVLVQEAAEAIASMDMEMGELVGGGDRFE
ncbi:hypothetical protein GCM10009680_82160 [Streptomyces yatensis]|uniref:Uncharacterized protein n=1 Tax=Streptomyces yatensis TaxID=155177 RepID=A0ABN2JIM3_9ACTN